MTGINATGVKRNNERTEWNEKRNMRIGGRRTFKQAEKGKGVAGKIISTQGRAKDFIIGVRIPSELEHHPKIHPQQGWGPQTYVWR